MRVATGSAAPATVLFDAPGPRARTRHRAISVITVLTAGLLCWVLYSRLSAKGQLSTEKWKPFLTADLWRTYVLPGVAGTLTAAAWAIALALILGVALGVGRLSRVGPVRWSCAVVVEFFRAIPVLIMMIFAYFLYGVLDALPPQQIPLASVVTGLTLYNGAVIAEIVRAGVHALPGGQSEAAAALGLSWGSSLRLVLLPQAVTTMLPVLVSQLVVALKDTAIGYQITFVEMVRQGTVVGSQYSNYLPALLVIAALMITGNMVLSAGAIGLERRLRRSRHTPLDAAAIEPEGTPGARVV